MVLCKLSFSLYDACIKKRGQNFIFAVEVFDYLWHKYESEAHAKHGHQLYFFSRA